MKARRHESAVRTIRTRRFPIRNARARNAALLFALLPAVCVGQRGYVLAGVPSSTDSLRVEVRIVDGARVWPERNRWSADVVARDGTRLYTIERDVAFDFPYPTLTVANDGSGVLLDAAQGRVEFLTSRGAVAAAWAPFASPYPSYERIIKCSIGGETAAFLLSEPGAAEVRVITTALGGRVIRETAMPGSSAGEIVVAADGSAILASATIEGDEIRHVTRVLGRDGSTLLEVPILFRSGDINPAAGRYLFADRHTVVGGIVGEPVPAFRSGVCRGDRIITAVRRGPGRSIAVTEQIDIRDGAPAYIDPEVLILADDGAILERARLESTSGHPASISREGAETVVRAGTKTARFRGIL